MIEIMLALLGGGVILTIGTGITMRLRRENRANLIEAPTWTKGACPVCPDSRLLERAGDLLEARCPTCDGRLLAPDTAHEFVYAPRGIDPGALKDAASGSGSGVASQCPSCGTKMAPVVVDTDIVDVCRHCGALWCDQGELSRLTTARG